MNLRPSLAFCLIGLFSACAATPPPERDPAPDYDPTPAYPHWAGRPVTWSKLSAIEDWLAGPGPKQYPEFVPTAQLELAEGRLALAQENAHELAAPVLAGRLKSAEDGFKAVLERDDLRPQHKQRAEKGLAQIAELRSGGTGRVAAGPASKSPPAASAPAGLAIQPRSSWNASQPLVHRLTPAGDWSRITIHHSAMDSKEIGVPTSGNVAETIKKIQTFHMRDRGWGDIAYHFLIDPTGRIWQGRLLDWQGAHAQGANNIGNIGICLLGDFQHERPDPRALEALEHLVDRLCERHHIARNRVYGHQKFAPTDCPGDALMAWVARYAAGATH